MTDLPLFSDRYASFEPEPVPEKKTIVDVIAWSDITGIVCSETEATITFFNGEQLLISPGAFFSLSRVLSRTTE